MPISVTHESGGAVIALSGEVDHHGARTMMAQIDETIAQLLPMHLTLDLSGVTFMDSSGIAVLLCALRQIQQIGGALRVTSIPTQARRVLDAAGVGRLVTLE